MKKKNNELTTIHIQDNICWRCGKTFENGDRTAHHGIPRALKPLRNVVIPLCADCHEELNAIDFSTMLSYLCKVKYQTAELNNNLSNISKMLESIVDMQSKIDVALKIKEED